MIYLIGYLFIGFLSTCIWTWLSGKNDEEKPDSKFLSLCFFFWPMVIIVWIGFSFYENIIIRFQNQFYKISPMRFYEWIDKKARNG